MGGMIERSEVLELLHYDPTTGVLTWLVDRANAVRAGMTAGSRTGKGAVEIRIHHRPYFAHRLAWLITYGSWPEGVIDHANGDPADNRLSNLRLATVSQNAANKKLSSSSTSGLKGVCWHKKSGKWQAAIKVDGKNRHLGLFSDALEAHEAYKRAAVAAFGQFARAA